MTDTGALRLSPWGALPWLLGGLACAVLITQYLEFAVVSTLHRLDWPRATSLQARSLAFYQCYWGAVVGLLLGTLVWLYATDRWAYKAVYGLVGFVVLEALQLSVAILLTSWKDMADRLQTQLQRRPWLQELVGGASTATRGVTA